MRLSEIPLGTGNVVLDGVEIQCLTPDTTIKHNIDINRAKSYDNILRLEEWREFAPVAIVGGGSTLSETIKDLQGNHGYRAIFACGSVHDYLVENGVNVDYTIACDADPLVKNYLKKCNSYGRYLVASQCDPSVFEYLKENNCKIAIWHAGRSSNNDQIFADKDLLLGGGCTVGTRAIVIAYNFGFNNMHLYGFDTCIHNNKSHAYDFDNPETESIKKVLDITVGNVKFTVAEYMLGQLFDFKALLAGMANRVKFTVHGEGALHTLMELGKQKV